MNDFHLREHVRQVLATTPGEDLDALVDAVFNATPESAYASAYRQALAPIIRVSLRDAERPDPTTAQFGQPRNEVQESPAELGDNSDGEAVKSGSEPNTQTPLPVGPNVRNSRAARILRRNRFRKSISLGDGIYRDILECTVADLERAAAESEQLADENYAAARRYRKLVKVMVETGAETAGDLTDETLEEAFDSGE